MIKRIEICDKCGKEIDHVKHTISVKWDDGTFMSSTNIHLCKKCYEEFMITYLEDDKISEKEIEIVMNALTGTQTFTSSEFANKVEKILRDYKGVADSE